MNTHLLPWAVESEAFPADGFVSDRLEFLLRYAILAPSPHNSQPWLFRIHATDLELFADRRRASRVVDPYDRELTLACGAALYNLRVAAEYFGQGYTLDLLPDPRQPNLLARFALGAPVETSAEDVVLFGALGERRTNRETFLPDPIPGEVLDELAEAAAREGAWFEPIADDYRREAVAGLIAEAIKAQWSNREFRHELAGWVRTNAEQQADGIPPRDMGLRDWLAFAGPVIVRTFDRGRDQAAREAELAARAPVLAVLGTDADEPVTWLQAGQALEAVLLHVQGSGLAASPLNQPIQVPEFRPQLASFVGRVGFPQVLLRLGHGPVVPPTPRRELRRVLLAQDHAHDPPH